MYDFGTIRMSVKGMPCVESKRLASYQQYAPEEEPSPLSRKYSHCQYWLKVVESTRGYINPSMVSWLEHAYRMGCQGERETSLAKAILHVNAAAMKNKTAMEVRRAQ